jgi:anthranilate synthase component 1
MQRRLQGRTPRVAPRLARRRKSTPSPLPESSVAEREAFTDGVLRIQEYIRAGDCFQAVLSRRIARPLKAPPFEVYRALRSINPSPYMFYLAQEDFAIAGASPEMLIRVTDGEVSIHPIAGTRKRGADPERDAALARELLADEKERAEHVMLVDLGRNDLGRVSDYGSVKVRGLMYVERYSHVMHLVSALEGRLRPELNAMDAFAACFPAGTLSGAPKVRAMQIIEELEPTRRGVYGGAVLYADFAGNLDSCIAIRTLLMKGKKAYLQAGAGIVADSDPQREFEETENKARAVLRAVEMARGSG